MRDYIDYMDKLSVSESLHEKIMKKATQRPGNSIGPLASLTAGALMLLVFGWGFYSMMNSEGTPALQTPSETAEISAVQSQLTPSPYPLTFNTVLGPWGHVPLSIYIPNAVGFGENISKEHLAPLFPNLPDFFADGFVDFLFEGGVSYVTAWSVPVDLTSEEEPDMSLMPGIHLFFAAPSANVDIQIGIGYEPQISVVKDIPVTALIREFPEEELPEGLEWYGLLPVSFFQTHFQMEGFDYLITFAYNTYRGKAIMQDLVYSVIAGGPPDLSSLADIPRKSQHWIHNDRFWSWRLETDTETGIGANIDPRIYALLPENIPHGLTMPSVWVRNASWPAEHHVIEVLWGCPETLVLITWEISEFLPGMPGAAGQLVSGEDFRKLDGYESYLDIPLELRPMLFGPVFQRDELTLEAIEELVRRRLELGVSGAEDRISLAIVHDDMIKWIRMRNGVDTELIWRMLP